MSKKKSKSFRLNQEVAEEFSEFCSKSGIVQERIVEALFLFAIDNLDIGDLGIILANAEKRIAGQLESAISSNAKREITKERELREKRLRLGKKKKSG